MRQAAQTEVKSSPSELKAQPGPCSGSGSHLLPSPKPSPPAYPPSLDLILTWQHRCSTARCWANPPAPAEMGIAPSARGQHQLCHCFAWLSSPQPGQKTPGKPAQLCKPSPEGHSRDIPLLRQPNGGPAGESSSHRSAVEGRGTPSICVEGSGALRERGGKRQRKRQTSPGRRQREDLVTWVSFWSRCLLPGRAQAIQVIYPLLRIRENIKSTNCKKKKTDPKPNNKTPAFWPHPPEPTALRPH